MDQRRPAGGGDTAQGADIYHWRFAPRRARSAIWTGIFGLGTIRIHRLGDQVQDGWRGAGFSYHDLMARLKVLGPDNAWQRLREIIRWFDDVQAAAGIANTTTAGAKANYKAAARRVDWGWIRNFFESVLVPQVMLDGFLGFAPRAMVSN
jgi:hypothetical protein